MQKSYGSHDRDRVKPVRWPALVVLYGVSLFPIVATTAVFIADRPTREAGIDALALLFGSTAAGSARVQSCTGYVEHGRYRYTGYRCVITIDTAGEPSSRLIDVSDAGDLDHSIHPARVFGVDALSMPPGRILDRLRNVATLLVLAAIGFTAIVAMVWYEFRRLKQSSSESGASNSLARRDV